MGGALFSTFINLKEKLVSMGGARQVFRPAQKGSPVQLRCDHADNYDHDDADVF